MYTFRDGFYITVILSISFIVLLINTEIMCDHSIINNSLYYITLGCLLFTFLWHYVIYKYSLIVSLLNLVCMVTLCTMMIQQRNVVNYYTVDEPIINNIINDYNYITIINGVIVFLYESKCNTNNSIVPLSDNRCYILRKDLLNKININCKKRTDKKIILVHEDFNSVKCTSKKEVKKFTKMLNSIYFSKLEHNIIIILRVFDILNLTENGFKRPLQYWNDKENVPLGDANNSNTKK